MSGPVFKPLEWCPECIELGCNLGYESCSCECQGHVSRDVTLYIVAHKDEETRSPQPGPPS